MAFGMPANRRVAASDVAAAETDAQVHRTRSLPYAVLADAWPVRLDRSRSMLQVPTWTSRHSRRGHCLGFEPIRALGGNRQHGLLDVERAEHLLDDVVVDGATGANLQNLVSLDVDGLEPEPAILLGRCLIVSGPAEFFPHGIRPGCDAVPQQLHRLCGIVGADNVGKMRNRGIA